MKSELYVVPPQLVHKYWHMAEPHLKLAIEKGNGEFELNDLRYVCSRGEQQLLMVMRDNKCHCALTTIFYNFPKFRTCYISYIGGRNTAEGMEQFKKWASDSGCDRITGSAVTESVAKLWSKLYGFEKKYITVEMKLNEEDKNAKG
jgi:hypothetical protein